MLSNLLKNETCIRLINERKKCGMSKKRLAQLSYTNKAIIDEIENGNLDVLNFDLLVNICKALEISAFSFLEEDTTVHELLNTIQEECI